MWVSSSIFCGSNISLEQGDVEYIVNGPVGREVELVG